MKKILLGISFIILGVGTTTAQNFNYPVGQHLVKDVVNENYESYHIDIETDVPQAIHYKWTLISNTFPSAWSYSLCDYTNCAVGVPPNGSMTPITLNDANNGANGFFTINLTVGQNYGHGKIEIYIYDANDITFGDTVSWDVTWIAPAALNENVRTNTLIYPNPINDVLKIENPESSIQNVQIVTMSGELVYASNYNSNAVSIETSHLNSGIYILKLELENGSLVRQKVVVK
ncbi:MAG: T9SS type A sorting domain-containing protein [Crocinitomicaceae bacterium]